MVPPASPSREWLLSGLAVLGLLLAAVGALGPAGPWGGAGVVLVYLAGGVPAARRAFRALWRERVLDIDLLMVVAAVAAALVGAALEGAVLLTLFSLSTTLEARAMGKARRAVEALMTLRPDTALLRSPAGEVTEVPVARLVPGEVAILRPGARVPVDGVILEGEGALDEATITGESRPVRKRVGDAVFEATVNVDGVLAITVTRGVAESTVARMIALVTEAQASRAPSERFSEWFGQRYTVGVLLGALAVWLVLWGVAGQSLDVALYRAATLLVAASPCAVVISVPAAILSALAAAARAGVLFKGGAALETLAEVRAFAFDKTGTLTTGRTEVKRVVSLIDEAELLALAAGVEAESEHHVAAAIRRLAVERGLSPLHVEGAHTLPSEGMVATHGENRVWAGNARLAARMGARVDLPEFAALAGEAETIVWLGRGAEVLGALSAADRPRESASPALAALRAAGVETVMMTGDRREVGLRVGAELGFAPADVYAGLLPQDKVRLVAQLAAEGKVAFVGDGVNDAAALARADVGIAMGAAGSEIAIQAADVALLSEEIERLVDARHLARRARRVVRQNLCFALAMMGVLVLASLFGGLPLPLAVLGHEGGTVLVVLNGLRLLRASPARPRAAL